MTPNSPQPTATTVRIVLDTNVVMDMLHFHDARTNRLEKAIAEGRARCFCDANCLAELERVAAYPEFALDREAQDELMRSYRGFIVMCETAGEEPPPLPRCSDKDDQKFLELAARCDAAILVTRDKQLLKLARHRHKPPSFTITTAEKAEALLELPPENPAPAT